MFGLSQKLGEGYKIGPVCYTASKNASTPDFPSGHTRDLPQGQQAVTQSDAQNLVQLPCRSSAIASHFTLPETCSPRAPPPPGTHFHLQVPSSGICWAETQVPGLPKPQGSLENVIFSFQTLRVQEGTRQKPEEPGSASATSA